MSDYILFSTADDVNIDISAANQSIIGEKVSLSLNQMSEPFLHEFTIMAERNDAYCVVVADDLRNSQRKGSLLGVVCMPFENFAKC